MTVLILIVSTTLVLSFVCSILEATLLSVRDAELEDRRRRGDHGAALLFDLKKNRIEDAISSILTLNTVSNTVGSALAGAQAARHYGETWAGVCALVLTFLVLIFSEIIPKTLGTVHASKLVGFVARATQFLTWSLKPIVWMLRFVTRGIASGERQVGISRGELAAMVNLAAREGAVPTAVKDVMHNALQLGEIEIEDVMTPRTVIGMLPAATTIAEFLDREDTQVFSRIPLYEDNHDSVIGFVLQRDVLLAAAQGKDRRTPLSAFLRKAPFIQQGQSIGRVMRRLIESREHLALVTDEYGGISGLETLEDLVETTLGVEILDESDRVVDLRAEAAKLREQRLETLRKWRQDVELGTTEPESEGD